MDNKLINQLKNEKFDLGLCEMFHACGYALFGKIGIKNYVTALSTNIQEVITEPVGISNNPSFVPGSYSQFMDTMSYKERFINFILYIGMHIFSRNVWFPNDKRLHEMSPTFDTFMNQIGKTSFLFVNSDELLDFPRLISHKVIFIGGIAVQQPKPLNEDYQMLMDSAKEGAVLVSFGTIAKSTEMDQRLKQTFANTFRSLPNIKFLLKYEEDDQMIAAPNIIKKAWLPQNDLLHHPNLKVFITHCGLNSLMESVYAAVPVICIPLFGDQLRNSKIAQKRGIGVNLCKKTLSVQNFSASIQEVLISDKYRNSVRKLSKMMKEKPFTPRERFLRNVEFALKFGPIRNFDIASNNLSVFQYYLLDIIIPLLILVLFPTCLSIKFISRRLLQNLYKLKKE